MYVPVLRPDRVANGYFYIVDRKKDMIITGGFNVFCAELEASIMALPEVYDCAVIGVPHNKWGEAVMAVVVLKREHALTGQAVVSHCKAQLGGVKAPKTVEFREEIPRTPAGKIDKRALRQTYWVDTARDVH